ncbi:MAG: hypothetical protein WA708_00050 [Acidobacteriaceae bacterium]
MRPKKRIAIWGAGGIAGGLLRYVLETRGYAVELVAEETRLLDPAVQWDAMLLVGLRTEECDRLERAVWRARPGIAGCGRCRRVVSRGQSPEAEWIVDVLQKVRLATIRKRGPRPAFAGTSLAGVSTATAVRTGATA